MRDLEGVAQFYYQWPKDIQQPGFKIKMDTHDLTDV